MLGRPCCFDHFCNTRVVFCRKVVFEGKNCDCPDDEAMARRSAGSDINDMGLAMWLLTRSRLGWRVKMELQWQGRD